MRPTPRHVPLALALLLACCASARTSHAQTRPAAAPSQSKAAAQRVARARADRSARRAAAMLLEVAGGAQAIEDGFRRASVLALCADALWNADEKTARAVFGRAWEAAAGSDEAEFKEEQEHGRYGDLPERFTRAREMVLAGVSRRDARLSEAWLGALADWVARHSTGEREGDAPEVAAPGAPDIGPLDESTREGQRLALASTLADEGSYSDAASVAAPAVQGTVSGALVEFLLKLRAGSPEEADRLYLQLLAAVRARHNSTANDVLLLSSYALTPRLLAAVNPDGSVSFRPLGNAQDAATTAVREASRQVRSVFYDTAASVLLLRPPQDAATSVPGRETHAIYFAIGRLLPFFERESLRHAEALQARLMELAGRLGLERRAALDPQMGTLTLSLKNPADPLGNLLDTVAKADDPKLRDAARLQAVEAASKRRLWERAGRLTEEVEELEQRRVARAMLEAYKVAWVRESFDDEGDDFEKAAALSRGADVPAALRAYGLAQAAQFAARRGERARAAALVEEAFAEASQADAGTYARDAALLMTAAVAAQLEWPRAWEALAAAVAALNQDEEFDGDAIRFNAEARADYGRGVAGALDEALGGYDVREPFEAAARRDFERAAAEARNLKSATARSLALVAAARVELEKAGRAPGQLRPVR